MQTATRSSTVLTHALTLLFGAIIAGVIWLAGYAGLSWLGFAAAALYGDTPACRRARSCLLRRPAR
jgi:hypothetical protein